MILLIIFGAWVVFALISGFAEAYYFSAVYRKKVKRVKYDHEIFTVFRGIIAIVILYFSLGVYWNVLFIGVSLMAIFPFFHDGMYYLMRDKLDGVYSERWKAHSTTSTAKTNFNYKQRCWLVWLAVILTLIWKQV